MHISEQRGVYLRSLHNGKGHSEVEQRQHEHEFGVRLLTFTANEVRSPALTTISRPWYMSTGLDAGMDLNDPPSSS